MHDEGNSNSDKVNPSVNFDVAIHRMEKTGFHLARLKTLELAIEDKRLPRSALRVLSALIGAMRYATHTAVITADEISALLGMPTRTTYNAIWQLRMLGYIISETRTNDARDETELHWTLVRLSPEEIEDVLTRIVTSIREDRDSVVPFPSIVKTTHSEHSYTQNEVLATCTTQSSEQCKEPALVSTRETKNRACAQNEVLATCTDQPSDISQPFALDSTRHVDNTVSAHGHLPAICTDQPKDQRATLYRRDSSNINSNVGGDERGVGREGELSKRLTTKTSSPQKARGTRLAEDWQLPRSWGMWAINHFIVSPDDVRAEAGQFKDFWLSKSGADATKVSWERTWRNWIRTAASRKRWRRRKLDESAAPDLLSHTQTDNGMDALAQMYAQERQGRLRSGE